MGFKQFTPEARDFIQSHRGDCVAINHAFKKTLERALTTAEGDEITVEDILAAAQEIQNEELDD